jgi:hypothetical protein
VGAGEPILAVGDRYEIAGVIPPGQHSYYEILRIPPGASQDEVEEACVSLWYRYQSMRGTPLWKDISLLMEEIHSTLGNPEARQRYDEHLAKSGSQSIARILAASVAKDDDKPAAPADSHEESQDVYLFADGAVNLRGMFFLITLATALLFNQLVEWICPENWSDIGVIAWLTLFLCLAATCLAWCALNLFPIARTLIVARVWPPTGHDRRVA